MILMDTNALAWLVGEPEKLTGAARKAIVEARSGLGLAISDKTLWELAMMVTRRKINIATSLPMFLKEIEGVCTVLPIDAAVAMQSMQFTKNFPARPG